MEYSTASHWLISSCLTVSMMIDVKVHMCRERHVSKAPHATGVQNIPTAQGGGCGPWGPFVP